MVGVQPVEGDSWVHPRSWTGTVPAISAADKNRPIPGVRFGVLGPLTVWHQGQVVTPRSSTIRATLAVMLIAENQPVTAGRLATLVRPDRQGNSRAWVQVLMSRLRTWLATTIGDSMISLRHRSDGYVLTVPPEQVDLGVFRRMAAAAEHAEPEHRLAGWEHAAELWRGHALADVEHMVGGSVLRELAELQLTAVLKLADQALLAGVPERALPQVIALANMDPLNERLHATWARLLFAAGRQGDALEVVRQAGRRLSDELGIGIGRHLLEVQQSVLQSLSHNVIGMARVSPHDDTVSALATLLNADRPIASRLAHRLNGKNILLVVAD